MKTPSPFSSVLFALGLAVLGAGWATTSYSAVPTRQLQTYAIVAVDDQGIVAQSELDKIVDTLAQFLIDQGYVTSDQVLIADPVNADVVFRMKIAWPATGESIAILGVAPSYSGGSAYAPSPVAYVPPSPWVYDDWPYDPWWYGDYYCGYSYGPYCPFLTVFPFISFYGFDHYRRPAPPYFRHFLPPVHRSQSWARYNRYIPPWRPGGGVRPPLIPPHRPRPAAWADRTPARPTYQAARRSVPVPSYRASPSLAPAARPRIPYSDQRRISDSAMARPQYQPFPNRVLPQNAPAQFRRYWDSNRRRAPDAAASHSSSPAPVDRPAATWGTSARSQRTPASENRPPPDYSQRRPASADRPAPAGGPQRQSAAPQHYSPPPQREYAAPRRDYSPQTRESSAAARSYSPAPARVSSPPPAPAASSSSNARGDSGSRSNDRGR